MGEPDQQRLDERADLCVQERASCKIFDEYRKLELKYAKLQAEARQDHLTGLYNARQLAFSLEQEMERTVRTWLPTTFILLDIDHFKRINDSHGHKVGDKALQHLSTLLQSNIRKIDIACRYGGEEFAIILPTTPLIIGIQVAERIRQTLENTPLAHDEGQISMTASFGVDSYTASSADSPDDFVARVDALLYTSKHEGRNRVTHASLAKEVKGSVSRAEKEALFAALESKNGDQTNTANSDSNTQNHAES